MASEGGVSGAAGRVVVTVVSAPACHYCEDAEAWLGVLRRTVPFTLERVRLHSPAGQDLVRMFRPAMSPLVLVDGEYFSSGRLPGRKLARLLERRAAVVAG